MSIHTSGQPLQRTPSATMAEEEALRWSEQLRAAPQDAQVRAAFEAWRGNTAANSIAFEQVERAWLTVQAMTHDPRLLALRNETLARVAVAHQAMWKKPAAIAAMAAGLVVVGAALWQMSMSPKFLPNLHTGVTTVAARATGSYETHVGERLIVTLEDGSVMTLNTRSRATVAFSAKERVVTLHQGQALFKVAERAQSPFIVNADQRRITALGTSFDVRISEQQLQVTLIEGRVAIERPLEQPRSTAGAVESAINGPVDNLVGGGAQNTLSRTELSAGEQLIAVHSGAVRIQKADVRRVTSWRDGQIAFDNDSLASAVGEMNRYARCPIVMRDPELGQLRISGAFETDQTAAFVEALKEYFPIDVVENGGKDIVLTIRR